MVLWWVSGALLGQGAPGPDRITLEGHVPAILSRLTPIGELPATNEMELAIGLPLRNQYELERFLSELQDPRSSNYHKYLSPAQFTQSFGPTQRQYDALITFASEHGLRIRARHSNRVVLDVEGSVASIEQAFQVKLRVYRHPSEARSFFAPDQEPSVPVGLPVEDLWGLSDFQRPRPLLRRADHSRTSPLNNNGSGPAGSYQGSDFRKAYAPGSGLAGGCQAVAVVEFDGYYANDITTYERNCGYTNVPLQNVLIDNVSGTPGYSGQADAVAEVSLDIEMAIAMAPGLAKVMVYEGSNPYNVLNRIVTDNQAAQISCSWAWGSGPTRSWGRHGQTLDSQLQQMAAQGQSFFQASGDSDAYTGNQAFSAYSGPIPVDSVYVTSVGGTTLSMVGTGGAYASETVWNWGNNTGSGGGISPNYSIPSWQAGTSMTANGGSTVYRNVPDVALTADAINVVYNNGSSGVFGGTSCAAPLWAGFTALVNQQSAAAGQARAGFLNPALYNIGNGANGSVCFHDTMSGNNIGTNTPGLFYAETGYDLCTGWGTPNGTNLINALAPYPCIVTAPRNQTIASGGTVSFQVTAGGQPPFSYQWWGNGTALASGGNIFGATSNVLTLSPATTADTGDYSVVVTSSYGSITSAVAALSVVFPPSFTSQPTNQIVAAGANAVFSANVSGALPLSYQWQKNGTSLSDGGAISGATTDILTLSAVTLMNAGNYRLIVTNVYGTATSSVAVLAVTQPPVITTGLIAQTVQCGGNAVFAVAASGSTPLSYQWTLDGLAVSGATGTSLSLPAVHVPDHTIEVMVTNLYGSVTDTVVLSVQDTLPPVITVSGSNPLYVELGALFTDPGASALDACSGSVPALSSGLVNTSVCGTNSLLYTATDPQGNKSTATRTVIVRDTTPPVITWSFGKQTLSSGTNCTAAMPDVTGTNFIVATDLSEPLAISQEPTNNAELAIGTNTVVITVADAFGNLSYSTNEIVVVDQNPPVILSSPASQTNTVGASVSLNVLATACTPVSFQWYFNNAPFSNQTNSSLTLSNLGLSAAGDYYAVAAAAGGFSTSAVATLSVGLRPAMLVLDSSLNPAGLNDAVYFTASVQPAQATGTVQFLTNSVVASVVALVPGQAASTGIALLPRGTNSITAVYSGDANDLPCTDTLLEVVTNHPPMAVDAFFSRAAGASLEIAVSNLATYWSDVDGDTVSLAGVGLTTNGVYVTNNLDTLVYFNSNNVPDQFVCTITDGWGGTNFQMVTISILLPAIASALANPDGTVSLELKGAPGSTCVLEATSSLSPPDWMSMATSTLDTNGVWRFTDSGAATVPQRFYRLRQGP